MRCCFPSSKADHVPAERIYALFQAGLSRSIVDRHGSDTELLLPDQAPKSGRRSHPDLQRQCSECPLGVSSSRIDCWDGYPAGLPRPEPDGCELSRLGSAAKAGTAAAGAATLTLALKGTNIGTVAFAAGKPWRRSRRRRQPLPDQRRRRP